MKTIDWRLVIYYLLLILIGWVNIYASVHSSEPTSIFDWECRSGKQFVWILTSFVLAAVVSATLRIRLASPETAIIVRLTLIRSRLRMLIRN